MTKERLIQLMEDRKNQALESMKKYIKEYRRVDDGIAKLGCAVGVSSADTMATAMIFAIEFVKGLNWDESTDNG